MTARRRLAALGLAAAALAAGVLSAVVARRGADFSFAGGSDARLGVELCAGWALAATGIAAWLRGSEGRFGVLLVAAACGWFAWEWNNPAAGASVVFTLGLILYASAAPLLAHAALAYPSGHLRSRWERAAVALAYAGGVAVLGLVPALLFDPRAQGCGSCSGNLVEVAGSHTSAYADVLAAGVWVTLGWAAVLVAVAAARVARATASARRAFVPVLAPAVAFVVLFVTQAAHGAARGYLSNDGLDTSLRMAQAAALLAVALGVLWLRVRTRMTRAAVARVVVDVAASPPPGGLEGRLAHALGDPTLRVAYPLEDGRLIDGRARPVELAGATTPLIREGDVVAVLSHRPGLLDDAALVDELAATARLALDFERLNAEARAQLEDLRRSRARIVAAADAERQRLERDCHDGAQQRLVTLALSLQLLRDTSRATGVEAKLQEAQRELATAIADLREVAHGIYPAILADEGLAAAIEDWADTSEVPVEVHKLPAQRAPAPIESAAYFTLAESARQMHASRLGIRCEAAGGELVLEVVGEHGRRFDIQDLEDRVGALDGRLELVAVGGDRTFVHAALPFGDGSSETVTVAP